MSPLFAAFVAVLLVGPALLTAVMFGAYARIWLRAFLHGAPVPFPLLIAMKLRGNSPALLVEAFVVLKQRGVSTSIADVERAYISNRNRIATSDDLVELVAKNARTDAAAMRK